MNCKLIQCISYPAIMAPTTPWWWSNKERIKLDRPDLISLSAVCVCLGLLHCLTAFLFSLHEIKLTNLMTSARLCAGDQSAGYWLETGIFLSAPASVFQPYSFSFLQSCHNCIQLHQNILKPLERVFPSSILFSFFFFSTLLLSTSTLLSSQSYCFWCFPPSPSLTQLSPSVTFNVISLLSLTPTLSSPAPVSVQGPYQRVLLRELLRDYNPMERPVANDSQSLTVQFSFTLMQVMDVVCTAEFAP